MHMILVDVERTELLCSVFPHFPFFLFRIVAVRQLGITCTTFGSIGTSFALSGISQQSRLVVWI
jgi:hypothetical protein